MTVRNQSDADPREVHGSGEAHAVPCSLVHDLLPAAVGGELECETETVLQRHLSECLRCAREWRALLESHKALRSVAEGGSAAPEFDDGFFDDLHEGIVDEVRRQAQVVADTRHLAAVHRRRRAAVWSWVPVVGTLAATLLVGFFAGRFMDLYGERSAPEPFRAAAAQPISDANDTTPDWRGLIEHPDFMPVLMEAMRQFESRMAGSLSIERTAGGVKLVVDPSTPTGGSDY